jgi:hypothetical protein
MRSCRHLSTLRQRKSQKRPHPHRPITPPYLFVFSNERSGVSILLAANLRNNRKLVAYATKSATLKFIFDGARRFTAKLGVSDTMGDAVYIMSR